MSHTNVTKRLDAMPLDVVQEGNRTWWMRNTMSYDWKVRVAHPRYTQAWFDEIDARFIHAARLFATEQSPFDRIIPYRDLSGARVLEIGCGMGLHTELMIRAGARVTAIDISPTSIEATRRRLGLKGLTASLIQADAETMPLRTAAFDFVWSWGVIHHSARTARIVRQIARVLTPGGACRVMVYNREGMAARIAFMKDHMLRGGFLRGSFDQTLHHSTDGFSARHYVHDQLTDLFRAFFRQASCEICGQESDALPLPSFLRKFALRFMSEAWLRRKQAKRGSFLFLSASEPI